MKRLSGTLTNQDITVRLADLTYCHVDGEREVRVSVELYAEPPAFYVENNEPPFERTSADTLQALKEIVYTP